MTENTLISWCSKVTAAVSDYSCDGINKALGHVENLSIQRFLSIHPRFVFIVTRIAIGCTIIQTLDE